MQVVRQVLPVLQSLSEDDDSPVQAAAIEGLAQLLPLHGGNPELAGRLYSHLDDLVTNNQPQVSCQLHVVCSWTCSSMCDSLMHAFPWLWPAASCKIAVYAMLMVHVPNGRHSCRLLDSGMLPCRFGCWFCVR